MDGKDCRIVATQAGKRGETKPSQCYCITVAQHMGRWFVGGRGEKMTVILGQRRTAGKSTLSH